MIPTIILDGGILLDTCYIIHLIKHNRLDILETNRHKKKIGMTTFNIHELERKSKEMYLHYTLPEIFLLPIRFYPGHALNEKMFVAEIEPELLNAIDDPSDAVLAAAAIKFGVKTIITRDKHHLLTNQAKHLMEKYKITIETDL